METFMVVQEGSGFVAFRFKATPEAAKSYESIFSEGQGIFYTDHAGIEDRAGLRRFRNRGWICSSYF
jgi:hypothetical protein